MNRDEILLHIAAGVVVGFLIGVAFGLKVMREQDKAVAVNRGYAQYNTVTGDWEWKTKNQITEENHVYVSDIPE